LTRRDSKRWWLLGTLCAAALTLCVPAALAATRDDPANGTVSGKVTDKSGAALPAVQVNLEDGSGTNVDSPALTDAHGRYTLTDTEPGTYTIVVTPGDTLHNAPIKLQDVNVTSGETTTANLKLPNPPVPKHIAARNSLRDLRWLNRERVKNGLPGGIVLNHRWSTDCAAHDAYEHRNNIETHVETAGKPGYSTGGAWAGINSIINPYSWKKKANPWEPAPIHLAALYAPSLNVVGIDDSRYGWVCTTDWVGMQRTFANDTVSTYPGDGVRGVEPGENAHEDPFVPGDFVGLPAGTVTGRHLFVYLNQAGQPGQAQVKIVSASLSGPKGKLKVKTVDNSTPTVGPYLAGGIIIPVKPLTPFTKYTAKVTVKDGSGTMSKTWHFTTGKWVLEIA
jgi:hypothetical protein